MYFAIIADDQKRLELTYGRKLKAQNFMFSLCLPTLFDMHFEEVKSKQLKKAKVYYTSNGNSDLKVKFMLDDYAEQLEQLYDQVVEEFPELLV